MPVPPASNTHTGENQPQASRAVPAGASEPLLRVADLAVHFPIRTGLWQRQTGIVRAVDGVGFDIARGETLGLVGESGCGKTTVGRAILRLVRATAGRVLFEGRDVLSAGPAELKSLRRAMQIVFQDPANSLNPRMRVGAIVGEPLVVHGVAAGRAELRARVATLLGRCGLERDAAERYPHQFSGGQRQRIGIARALALSPKFIVCDEPTSALDVSIQAQIINLLMDLQGEFGLSYLFISHDMAVIQHVCRRIAVMQAGKIVEMNEREAVLRTPAHEYTRTLLSAVPVADPARSAGAGG